MNTNVTRIVTCSTAAVMFCLLSRNESRAQDLTPPNCIAKYAFYPHGGNFSGDLFPHFVDVDPTSGVKDWNCGGAAIDGLLGIDTKLTGFTAQAIGVPIFAALDGTVIETHDGENDMNTKASGQPENYVKLDHGGGQTTSYLHMKKGR